MKKTKEKSLRSYVLPECPGRKQRQILNIEFRMFNDECRIKINRYRRLGRIFNYLNKNVMDCLLPSFLVGFED